MAFEVQEVAMNRIRPGRLRPGLILALVALVCGFALAPGSARADAGSLPLGLYWQTVPWQPCGTSNVAIKFVACECQVDLQSAQLDSGGGKIILRMRANPGIRCFTCHPDSFTVDLGTQQPGHYARLVEFQIDYVTPPTDSSWVPSGHSESIEYSVLPTCSNPGGVPYLDRVLIGRPQPCEQCPPLVCPGDSIDVFLAGMFPNDCTRLGGVTLEPSPLAGPLPAPPTVRLHYEIASCLGRPCSALAQPWAARVRLPGLPALHNDFYALPVEAFLRDVCVQGDSLGTFLGAQAFAFFVAESCSTSTPPPYSCFNVRWGPDPVLTDPNPTYPSGCAAIYGPGQDVKLTFNVGAALRSIAGIQGRLVLDAPGGLAITDITAFPPGWQVARTALPDGSVRFIAFAGPGADPLPASRSGTPYPVFTVTVHTGDGELPMRARLAALDLLVSDAGGNAIPACPRITLDMTDDPSIAWLCRAPSTCDANRDGQTDVRDLVAMVNCLHPPSNVRLACTDSTGAVFDCDGDHDFDLADVFCCARRMLGGAPGGEGDSLRRDAPEIALRFGVPTAGTDGTLEVPLSFDGMAGVAAGRFDVTYPDARYEVVDVTIAGAPASWWTIHDITPGRVGIALLDLAGMAGAGMGTTASEPIGGAVATIRLRLRAGAAAGGELAVAAHDFAAADGYVLVTPNAAPRVALGSVGRVALSVAQPNPFGTSTSIALTLPEAGPADVAVFNAAGRRVATLLHAAHAAAGVYPLSWNGADDSGGRVAGGVYFVRVIGGTGNVSRKLLFLPGGVR